VLRREYCPVASFFALESAHGGHPVTVRQLLLFGSSVVVCSLFWPGREVAAQPQSPIVRIAELEIDPDQLESYKAALKQEIETSIRVEAGVLTLYAVSVKDHPAAIRIFETYADEAAYRAHLETAHFKKYKAATQAMVKSLKLIETEPVILGAKPR
jgi:quinol monooxygenase YgiN